MNDARAGWIVGLVLLGACGSEADQDGDTVAGGGSSASATGRGDDLSEPASGGTTFGTGGGGAGGPAALPENACDNISCSPQPDTCLNDTTLQRYSAGCRAVAGEAECYQEASTVDCENGCKDHACEELPFSLACDGTSLSRPCYDYTGSLHNESSVRASCQGTTRSECDTRFAIGSCLIDAGGTNEYTVFNYNGLAVTFTEDDCSAAAGVWTDL